MKRELFLGLCAAMSMATCVAFADEVQPKNVLKFDFGTGQTADGYIAVGEADKYDDVRGYGLESDANISSVVRKKGDKLTQDYLTADGLFRNSAGDCDSEIDLVTGAAEEIIGYGIYCAASGLGRLGSGVCDAGGNTGSEAAVICKGDVFVAPAAKTCFYGMSQGF